MLPTIRVPGTVFRPPAGSKAAPKTRDGLNSCESSYGLICNVGVYFINRLLPTDLVHGPIGLGKHPIVGAVLFLLRGDRSANQVGQLLVGAAGAQ